MSNPPVVTKDEHPSMQTGRRGWRAARYVAIGAIIFALLLYVGVCAWVNGHQRELLYYPESTHADAQTTDFSITHDGVVLRGWVIHPDMPNPILYFGGNGERVEGNRSDFADWFPSHSVYLLAYRGYGASDGKPSEAALFADAVSEFDRIQALHPKQSISVIGRSLGSGVASYLASQRPIAQLVLVTPFDSIIRVAQSAFPWLPMHWLIRDHYPSASYVTNYTHPVLIVRAGNDDVVPAEDTDRLVQAFPLTPVVINIPGRGHNDISKAPQYAQAMKEFLR
jgi:pimeloyl-ACP methyl ester carboxylesterase